MSLMESALAYQALGLSIIPVDVISDKKKPLISWSNHQESPPTARQIMTWWSHWPNAAIGLVTGRVSGVVVVDIDPKHGGVESDITKDFPTNVIVESPSGGCHLYYKYPTYVEDRVPNRVGMRKGIDIRADGGYVVLPPSSKADGKVYAWRKSFNFGDLKELPLLLYEEINTSNKVSSGDDPSWVSTLLTHGAKDGERDDSCTRLAGYLIKKGVPKDIVVTMLVEWDESKHGGHLGYQDVLKCVNSVYNKDSRKAKGKDENKPPAVFKLMGITDYINTYDSQEVQWLVDHWLPEATIAFMVAPPESYKTWILLDLAISIASGSQFLGAFGVNKTGGVIIVQQEDHHHQMVERLSVIQEGKGLLYLKDDGTTIDLCVPVDLPIYLHPDRELRFDDITVMDKLEEYIKTLKPRLVIVDPLYSASSQDDYMSKTVEHMWRFKKMRDVYNCSFLFCHHTKKSAEKGTTERTDLWGSQFLNAFLETGWQIRSTEEKAVINVRRHFKSAQGENTTRIQFEIDTVSHNRVYKVKELGALKDPSTNAPEPNAVLSHIQKVKQCEASDVAKVTGKHITTVTKQLNVMVTDGLLVKEGKMYKLSSAK